MRVLFFVPHSGHFRNFRSVLYGLADREHEVHIALDRIKCGVETKRGGEVPRALPRHANIFWTQTPARDKAGWAETGFRFRASLDYLRYFERGFEQSQRFRERAATRVPRAIRFAATYGGPLGRWVLRSALRFGDRATPISGTTRQFIADHNPDVVLVSPLVELGSPQLDYVRAARSLGIPTGLLVASWDNLTNKGSIHEAPELVTVWNEDQEREATTLHGVPADRIAVTGAAPYDHWFEWAPSRTREAFCEAVGLDPGRPYILYLGSSPFIAPEETRFVADWVGALRTQADHRLREAQVLVRPHPMNPLGLGDYELASQEGVTVFPPSGADPIDPGSRADYFDSIFYSFAVVGVNTSGFIESAIVGRPVHTLLSSRYAETQTGSLHFRYLLTENGGILQAAETYQEHARALETSLHSNGEARDVGRAFVESFVRPHGIEHAATPRMIAAIEALEGAEVNWDGLRPRTRFAGLPLILPARTLIRRHAKKGSEGKVAPRRGERRVATDRTRISDGDTGSTEGMSRRGRSASHGRLVVGVEPRRPAPRLPSFARRAEAEIELLRAQIDPIAEGSRPVIAGPFLGEVGFELLYWIPLLRWAVREFPGLSGRLVVVSRGGTSAWTSDVSGTYADVLSLLSPADLVRRRNSLKQRVSTEFEVDICRRVEDLLDLGPADVLHPALLYNTYARMMKIDQRAWARSVDHGARESHGLAAIYSRIEAPRRTLPQLPEEFIAVRFYFRPSFPDTDENRRIASSVIDQLASHTTVVLLNTGLELDEHRDFLPRSGDARVVPIAELMDPHENLAVQTTVISRARGFVGTYGGLAYLAPFLGVPSVGFSMEHGTVHPWHFDLAQRIFEADGWGSLTVLGVQDLDLVKLISGAAR